MTRSRFLMVLVVFVLMAGTLLAQAENPTANAQNGAAPAQVENPGNPGFAEIVFKAGKVNLFIWILIACTSFASVAFIVDGLMQTRREKILPPNLVMGVRESLDQGDLDTAMGICETNPCQLSNILMAGFTNIAQGYEAVQESVGAATQIESEKIIQRIGYLNLCGQVAPMLGLLGTVTGMVKAFDELSTAGADRDRQLATAISTALWTTVSGLLVAVPSLIFFTLYKNKATRYLLESEATVLDLITSLRDAEIENEDSEEEGEDWGHA